MTGRVVSIVHLVTRFREMGRPVTNEAVDSEYAAGVLGEAELALWLTMDPRDRRHSVVVTKRFLSAVPSATREEVAGALLHDVGKSMTELGRVGRAIATLVPMTASMRTYRRHEPLGADLLRRVGAHPRTVELVSGTADDDVADALRRADDDLA